MSHARVCLHVRFVVTLANIAEGSQSPSILNCAFCSAFIEICQNLWASESILTYKRACIFQLGLTSVPTTSNANVFHCHTFWAS